MYHSGKDYQIVDKMALRLRIDYCHFEKRLDVFKLAKQLNIILIKYSSLTDVQLKVILGKDELKDGFTIFKKGMLMIRQKLQYAFIAVIMSFNLY